MRNLSPGWSVTTWLIVINVAVFVVDRVLLNSFKRGVMPMGPLEFWGHFSADRAIVGGQVWRFITFQFLHSQQTFAHVLFNMIALYMFGRLVERYLGSRRYLGFYLLCGVAGPVMYLLLWAMGSLVADPRVPMVGASAAVCSLYSRRPALRWRA